MLNEGHSFLVVVSGELGAMGIMGHINMGTLAMQGRESHLSLSAGPLPRLGTRLFAGRRSTAL